MKELVEKQEKFISDDQINEFLEISSRRELLQREISENYGRYKKATNNRPDRGIKKKTNDLSMEIANVIQSIQDMDRNMEKFINERKDTLFVEIKGFRKGRKASKGYQGQSLKNPRFMDREG
jgi:hypothetical protein